MEQKKKKTKKKTPFKYIHLNVIQIKFYLFI